MTEKKFAEGIINQAPNIVFESWGGWGGGDRLIQIFFSSKEKKPVNHEKLICVDGVGDVGVGVYLL